MLLKFGRAKVDTFTKSRWKLERLGEIVDAIIGGLGEVVAGAMEVKGQDERMAVTVALMKMSLESERLMGAQIAEMLQVGTGLDVTA